MIGEALSAGRYGAYVWPAYGAAALGFAWMILDTLSRARRWRRQTERFETQGIEAQGVQKENPDGPDDPPRSAGSQGQDAGAAGLIPPGQAAAFDDSQGADRRAPIAP